MKLKTKMIKYLVLSFVFAALLCFTALAANLGNGLVIAKTGLNLREGPGTDYRVITTLRNGTIVSVNSMTDDTRWYHISYGDLTGFVSTDYLSLRGNSDANRGQADRPETSSSTVSRLLEYASKYLGTPYKYGGNGPNSFDCSGFTKYVFGAYGYSLPRTAADQAYALSTYVSKNNLAPGDLVFFSSKYQKIGHVGIYVGNGDFIHSSSPGDVVKYDTLNSGYYSNHYATARRINW